MTEEYEDDCCDTLGYLIHLMETKGPRDSARGFTAKAIAEVDSADFKLPDLIDALPEIFHEELLNWIRSLVAKENKKWDERWVKKMDRIADRYFLPSTLKILVAEEQEKNPGLSVDGALKILSERHPFWGKGIKRLRAIYDTKE